MRLKLLRLLTATSCFILLSGTLKAQNCIPTNINGAVINLACNQVCSTLVFHIPHIKGTGDYIVSSIPYNPYPYTIPTSNELTEIYVDDVYGYIQNLPFNFCFYDSTYNQFVAGSNGVFTFDIANASLPPPAPPCGNSYNQSFPIPYISFNICSNSAPYYPKASVMGMFTDLWPIAAASPPDRKVAWHIVGTAPCRKFVLNYYHVGMYGNGNWSPGGTNCNSLNPTTFQVVLYESTGLIDVNIEKKGCNGTVGTGYNAILGIQNWARDKAVAAPGKNATIWDESLTAYRFTPSGPGSRFVSSQLFTLAGALVKNADTLTTIPGLLDLSFPNVCFPPGSNQYVVKTTFSACDNPGNQLISLDTITVNRTNNLNAIATAVNASCGPPDGQITVTVPAGVGTPPFTYVLDGGAPVTGPSPHTFLGVAAGPHTIVVTDFSGGCTSTVSVTVGLSGNITATTSTTATSCVGVNNGSITITSASGIGPYTFSLDGGPPLPGTVPFTFNNVSAGPHTILVTDQGTGCVSNLINVNVPAGIGVSGNATSTATSCSGVANGTITVTALTGVAPFTWQLDAGPQVSGPNPFTFTNVAAGAHTVTIRDNIGCSIIVLVNVAVGPGINGSANSTATSCPAASNGTITATALSGVAPFTWQLDGGAVVGGASPHTFINVAAGAHTVTITDNLGCNVLVPVNVAVGPGINGSANSTATSCPAVANGTITATALSGVAPFTWQLDGGAVTGGASPHTFINVAAGAHTVTITDNLGCNVLVSVTVVAGPALNASITSTATACAAVSNGTITVNATTGTAPYTYQLDAGAVQSGANPYTFINVTAGTHTITVTDNFGCSFTGTVTVAVGPGVSGNASSTATSCPTAVNGTITADATAGTAPFTWQLDAGAAVPGATPHTFINAAAGAHTVTITDNFGCNITININVAAGPPLAANVTSGATSCSGASNGTITITPTSGLAPYTFSLDGGAPVAGASPYTFINVPAGNHTVVVTDAAGCVTNAIAVTVIAGPPLTTTVTTTDALCNGGSTGIITVTPPVIGTAPYQYSLNGVTWQASNIFNGLPAGNYTVYYRESNGCQGSQPVTVSEPAAITSSAATVAAVCNGQNNGLITITSGGGVAPYQYSIDGGVTWQASNIFTVAAGSYTITIRDANNCTKTQVATVTEPAVLTAASVNSNASCNGGNDGIITVNAAGGNSGYSYSLDGVTFQPSNVFNVAPGNYTVIVKDNLGCNTTFNTTVGLANNLTLNPQTDPTICEGTSVQLQLTSNATVYVWTPASGLSSTTISNPVANPAATTQYIVTATLGRCSANDTVIVNVNTAPIPNAGPDGFICYGQSYQLQGSGGMQYSWTPSTYLSSTSIANPVATPIKTITYTLSQVTDAIGCKSLITDQVTVDVTPPIKVKTFPYDTIGYPGDQFQLNATSVANIYSWSPATGLSNPNIPNPVVTVGPIGSDVLYQVIASTAAGCKGEGYVRLKVYTGPELYVPSAFTPNGDGLNDKFYPFPVGIKSINYFRVFNRWGQLLFSSTTLYQGWDGKMQGVEQPPGVYVFMAQGIDKNGKVLSRNGTVALIR